MSKRDRAHALQGTRAGFVSRVVAAIIDVTLVLLVLIASEAIFAAVRFLFGDEPFEFPDVGTAGNGSLLLLLLVVVLAVAWSGSGRTVGQQPRGAAGGEGRRPSGGRDPGPGARADRGRASRARDGMDPGEQAERRDPRPRVPDRGGLRLAGTASACRPGRGEFTTGRVTFRAVPTQLSHLDVLESESIHIFREVAAEFEKPVLLFSGGKDSIVMLRLAEKAFWPARIPFAVMHVDTGHNFAEVLEFRDRRVADLGVQLVVASVQASIDAGRVVEETGPRASRNRLQTVTLLDAITEQGFDAVFGGGRRDEEKARAKERVYSFRDDFGQWDPKNQRPELWSLYNGRHRKGEHIRVFPLSNWTELDIWQYIAREDVEIPSIYYAHRRQVFRRDGMWLAVSPFVTLMDDEEPVEMLVRYRTVGDASCTGAVESSAATVDDVIAEVAASRVTERGATRADDRFAEAAMEDRKREGYF